jgi:PX domain
VSVSEINLLKASILVQYASQIVIMRIKTEIVELRENYDVRRSMEDFHLLRKNLLRRYPYVLIPPLPMTYRMTKTHFLNMEKRVLRFVKRILQSELLKSDPDLYLFLTNAEPVTNYLLERGRDKLPELGLFNVFTE